MNTRGIFIVLSFSLALAGSSISFAKKGSRLTSDKSEKEADRRTLLLATGEDRVVDLEFDANASSNGISVGNPKVVAYTLVKDKKQIIFKPLSAGTSTVSVRDEEGNLLLIFDVKVNGTNLMKTANELRDLFKDIEGLNIRILGKKIILDGEVLVPNDYGRIINVLGDKSYSDLVLNLTSLSALAMQILAKKIQKDINAFAANVVTRVVNGQIWLEGTVDNIDQARRAARIAELYIPEVKPSEPLERDPAAKRLPPRSLVQNFLVVNPPPPKKQDRLVRVTFHFVELRKDYDRIFGFKWQPGFTSDPQITVGAGETGTGASAGTSFTATISSLFPTLKSAQRAGFARVLRTGTVIVRSGLPASINDETLIPYTQIAPNGEVTSATAGVGLTASVTPQILGQSEDIELDVDIAQVNQVGRSGTAPITAQHKVKTKLYVKSNESAAIAGVQGADIKTDFNKDDPDQGQFSGQTKPLFDLHRSKAYSKTKGQFVIFVTPQIVENASEGTDDLKKNFRVKVK